MSIREAPGGRQRLATSAPIAAAAASARSGAGEERLVADASDRPADRDGPDSCGRLSRWNTRSRAF